MRHSFGALSVICLFAAIGGVLAAQPHEDPTLKKWSETAGLPGVKGTAGKNVDITEGILLDISPPDLRDLTITATGRLVFDPRVTIELRAANIFVSGLLQIGSEADPYTGQLSITLTGTRASHSGETNPKVILVQSGGTLEIHGSKKLSWTKLKGTVAPIAGTSDLIFDHATNDQYKDNYRNVRGVAAYTFYLTSDGVPKVKTFRVYDIVSKGDLLAEQINDVKEGQILMMASQGYIRSRDVKWSKQNQTYEALETLLYGKVTGTSVLRSVPGDGATWAFVYQNGNPDSLTEETNPIGTYSLARFKLSDDMLFTSFCDGHPKQYKQNDNFRITTRNGVYPLINVIDDVTTWNEGDTVVFASTDYDYTQAEERTVVQCDDCSNKQFRINLPLEFTHFGEMLYNSVDMRGEVGVLTRNVVIRGEMEEMCPEENGNCDEKTVAGEDTFGAHVKVLQGYANVGIEGVELREVGQQTDIGRYPIHFHMCFDKIEGARPPYVRDVSIHNSFARCITVHGSHNVSLIDNVCYKHRGHGFFMEDGGEQDTMMDGNLAINTLKGTGLIKEPVDAVRPAGFWITNPLTRFRNNVAAGGEGTGIWFVYPEEPLEPSRNYSMMAAGQARRTAILEFDNNVAHSQMHTGIFIGNDLGDDRTTHFGNKWQPLENPLDQTSAPINVQLDRMTAYKNRLRNVWVEGGMITVSRASISDSQNGITLTNEDFIDKLTGVLKDSVVLGDSINYGEPFGNLGRSVPNRMSSVSPHFGIAMWKGPTKFENIWFADFQSSSAYDIAAIAKNRNSPYFFPVVTTFENVQFAFDDGASLGNRAISGVEGVDAGWKNKDGELISGFTYIETLPSGAQQKYYVVKPDHFSAAAADCQIRPNWRLAMCLTKYGNVRIRGEFEGIDAVWVRDDLPSAQITFDMEKVTGPQVVVDGSRTYTVHFLNKVPSFMKLTAEGFDKGDTLRVGVCLPLNAVFTLQSYRPINLHKFEWFVQVNSLKELDATDDDDGKKYYHDPTTGMLYFKFMNTLSRDETTMNSCPEGRCPELRIKITSRNLRDSDCRQRLYGDRVNKPLKPIPEYSDVIPSNGKSLPPAGWGAGSTRPFTNRAVVDGGYSEWSQWSECSTTCNAGTQTRSRNCDSPVPANGGNDCQGKPYITRACEVIKCPIDGGFTEWSAWTKCRADDGVSTNGFITRSRSCTNPAPQFNGVYCTGHMKEMETCTVS